MLHATDSSFQNEIQSSIPVLVKFGADAWCQPCKQIQPILEELEQEYAGKVKFIHVDIDETSIAQQYGIRGVPTILYLKNGEVVDTTVGAQSKLNIKSKIDSLTSTY